MNFFRKKNNAFITLEAPDFSAATEKLWGDLLYALEGHQLQKVTVRLYDAGDLPLRVISVVVSLGHKLKESNVALEIEASQKLLQMLRRLNMAAAFSQLTEVS